VNLLVPSRTCSEVDADERVHIDVKCIHMNAYVCISAEQDWSILLSWLLIMNGSSETYLSLSLCVCACVCVCVRVCAFV